MANSKISALTAQTTLASTDMLVVANSGSTTKKITVASLLTQMPGYEIGYDQVTSPVTVTSTTEASGTTVISCAAHTFDGSPVIAEFFCPGAGFNASDTTVSLFEGSTQIARLVYGTTTTGIVYTAFVGKIRFTPTAGSHTYTVTAFRSSANNSLSCGVSGTGAMPPMYIRFTKV